MDITTLGFKDTFTLILKHPTSGDDLMDGENAVSIELYGTASKQYRNAVTAMHNRAMRRKAKKQEPTAEQIQEEAVNLLVACSAGAANLTVDGEAVGSEDSFRRLYSNPRLSWVRDQVDEALGNTANFLSA